MKLSKIETQVLSFRDSGHSLEETARIMGWKGRERVRQVEARARRKILTAMKKNS
jgi:DNA-directed RNA polymerase sigma subunit (sigma70/sigma32)